MQLSGTFFARCFNIFVLLLHSDERKIYISTIEVQNNLLKMLFETKLILVSKFKINLFSDKSNQRIQKSCHFTYDLLLAKKGLYQKGALEFLGFTNTKKKNKTLEYTKYEKIWILLS